MERDVNLTMESVNLTIHMHIYELGRMGQVMTMFSHRLHPRLGEYRQETAREEQSGPPVEKKEGVKVSVWTTF